MKYSRFERILCSNSLKCSSIIYHRTSTSYTFLWKVWAWFCSRSNDPPSEKALLIIDRVIQRDSMSHFLPLSLSHHLKDNETLKVRPAKGVSRLEVIASYIIGSLVPCFPSGSAVLALPKIKNNLSEHKVSGSLIKEQSKRTQRCISDFWSL